MVQFKKIKVSIPGFKYETVYVQELSLRQMNEINKATYESDFDMFLASLAVSLVNEAGDRIITNEYTIDDFADAIPQSYIGTLSDAFTELNGGTEEKELESAKKS